LKPDIGSLLVVDDSLVMREMLRTLLAVHCEAVHTAGSFAEALHELRWHGDLDLVLCDVALPDGDGLALLEAEGASCPERRWILMTARPDPGGQERARALGAIEYLSKPVGFRDIARALRGYGHGRSGRGLPRTPLRLPASLVDPEGRNGPLVSLELLDVSASGAFLATPGPVPLGTRLRLQLALPAGPVRITARVVRVQEPAWGCCGGVGIRFEPASDSTAAALAAFLSPPSRTLMREAG
jgi:CheY-like chemotaxis protein